MKPKQPHLIIIAGANGSGKTTLAELLLPDRKISDFLNADEMARALFPFQPELKRIEAGRMVLKRAQSMLAKNEDFAIETTLAGRTLIPIITKAKTIGYKVEMFYFYTGNVQVNLKRIRQRVKQGGHHIPAEDVKRRYQRSLANFFSTYTTLCDTITVIGNALGFPTVIAYIKDGESFIANETSWQQMKADAQDK